MTALARRLVHRWRSSLIFRFPHVRHVAHTSAQILLDRAQVEHRSEIDSQAMSVVDSLVHHEALSALFSDRTSLCSQLPRDIYQLGMIFPVVSRQCVSLCVPPCLLSVSSVVLSVSLCLRFCFCSQWQIFSAHRLICNPITKIAG